MPLVHANIATPNLHRVLWTLRPARCYQHSATGPWQVVSLVAGSSKWRSLLMAGDDDKMLTRSLNVTPKTNRTTLIAHSDKSVAYVTNNGRLRSTFCAIEADYWQTWSIAHSLLRQQSYLFVTIFRTRVFLVSKLQSSTLTGSLQWLLVTSLCLCQASAWCFLPFHLSVCYHNILKAYLSILMQISTRGLETINFWG